MLSVIARELGKLNNDVVIEGHTDSRPYSQRRAATATGSCRPTAPTPRGA